MIEGGFRLCRHSSAHEHYSEVITQLVVVAAETFGLPLQSLRAMTMRQVKHLRGVEADCCFYVANAHRVVGKVVLDFRADPFPDICVEIDMSTDSDAKIPIYGGLGVPELWIYDGKRMRILELDERTGSYFEVSQSKFIPQLTAALLEEQLHLSKTVGQTELRKLFRGRLQS